MFGKQHEHNYKIVGAKSNDHNSLTYVLYRCDCSDVTVDTIPGCWTLTELKGEKSLVNDLRSEN